MARSHPPQPPAGPRRDKPTTQPGERCAFCGRREIEAGRLITGARAAICADCIRKLGQSLKDGGKPPR